MNTALAGRTTLSGFRGDHIVLYQLLDSNVSRPVVHIVSHTVSPDVGCLCAWQDYPLSQLMATRFRRGAFLDDLEAPLQTQAYYSLYPDRLFQRAQVGGRGRLSPASLSIST